MNRAPIWYTGPSRNMVLNSFEHLGFGLFHSEGKKFWGPNMLASEFEGWPTAERRAQTAGKEDSSAKTVYEEV